MTTYKVANLLRRLKGYSDADTQSQFEGWVGPGRYEVLDYKKKYPSQDSDYVKIDVDTLADNDTWICSRWKSEIYAKIELEEPSVSVPADLGSDIKAIEEADLVNWLIPFKPFRYSPSKARYPYTIPGIRVKISPPYQNNCCTFVEAIVVKAFSEATTDFSWDGGDHAQMMVLGNDLFSPVTVLVEKKVATIVDPDATPLPWSVIQGWRELGRRGHTFIAVAYHRESDKVLTLEANNHYKIDGVGFRNLGSLRDFPDGKVPQRWWEHPKTPTWREIRRAYPDRKQCALKIKKPQWAFQEG